MIGIKQLYTSMTRFKAPFGKTCAFVGAFSGFFGVNSYYLRKNCNHFMDTVEKEINIGGKIVINDSGININNQIIIDDNGIIISDKQIKTNNSRLARFKMNALDYLMIKNAPYSVNFLTGTIMGSAIGYIYGMYFPVTVPLTIVYAVVSNIIDDN